MFILQLVGGWRARHEMEFAASREHDLKPWWIVSKSTRILDLANGRLHPQSMILDVAGCRVFGVDLANLPTSGWTDRLYHIARWLYALRIYPWRASRQCRLICGDVACLPLEEDTFDLITSVAAFEHFLDVPSVVSDLNRVLRPGGLVWVSIHPFTCPSGGHNLKLMEIPLRTLPRGVDAWDHLRKRRLPFHVPLNEWRVSQYLDEFSRHFEILNHYCALREGEHFLTPEIITELSAYSPDELTCGAFVIVARKREVMGGASSTTNAGK